MIATFLASVLMAGFLDRQWDEGFNRYCKYTNGRIITIRTVDLCPLSVN